MASSRGWGIAVLLSSLTLLWPGCGPADPPVGGTKTGGTMGGGDTGGTVGGGSTGGTAGGGDTGGTVGTGGEPGGSGGSVGEGGKARALVTKLGRPGNFLVGLGNDLSPDFNHDKDGAFTLGVTLDLHYVYLPGLGWPDYNPGGFIVNILADTAAKHGVVPMFTTYVLNGDGREGRVDFLTDAAFMPKYWAQARLMFDRLAAFGKPAVVHLEPDFWGGLQQKVAGDPAKQRVLVKIVPECASLPDDLSGLGKCLVILARKISPKVAIGFHASEWAGAPAQTVSFLNAIGAGGADFVVTDALDRDAGCFEAKMDPNCQRGGTFYWDENNASHPNFHDHLAFVKTITDGLGRPMLWWQVPLGVPSNTPGGTPRHYRDNRVKYLFSHLQEFVDAGFAGAAFGVGAANQTDITTDGGQFKTAVGAYLGKQVALP